MFFKKIEQLESLEKKQEWEKCITLLNDAWEQNTKDGELNLRLATECWYVLSNWEFINNKNLEFNKIKNKLVQVYLDSVEKFEYNAKMSSIYGYMISLNPELFYAQEDTNGKLYSLFEKQGKILLEKAHKLEKNNKLYKVLYLGSVNEKKYNKAREELLTSEVDLFSGDTAIENYFNEILGFSKEKNI